MREPRFPLVLMLVFSAGLDFLPAALATEILPPSRPCVLVNDYKEIFVARVISGGGSSTARVQVMRTYKGSVPSRLIVSTSLLDYGVLDMIFKQGETYIFYSSGEDKDRKLGRVVTFWSSKRLSEATPEEKKLLDEIDLPPHTGSIFGTLTRHLDYRDKTPLTGIRVVAVRSGRNYSGITDSKGNFEISGLPKGIYRVGAVLPEDLTFGVDEDYGGIRIEPHGCFEKDLFALNNAIISGRITLPPGLKVEGTKVLALSAPGRGSDLAGVADRHGQYEIAGLTPGEYVVGVNLGFDFPRAKAPFPATYFPGTQDVNEAKKFVIHGKAQFTDVNFSAGAAKEVVPLRIKATFQDGRPVQNQLIGLSDTAYGTRDGKKTDSEGEALLAVVRGERYFVMAYGGAEGGCPGPVEVGPGPFPAVVHLVYSPDGCREMDNTTQAGTLRARFHNQLIKLSVTVGWADGSPAYKANVSVTSTGGSVPFSALFRTGKDGKVDVPIPLDQEFRMSADVICSGTRQESPTLLFDTANGISWRELGGDQSDKEEWNIVPTPAASLHFVLPTTECGPENKSK